MNRSPPTLLALMVREADPFVADLRERFDPSASRALGAHITMRFNWLRPDQLSGQDHQRIADLCARTPSFSITFSSMAEFPGTVYLEPSPQRPIVELASRIDRHYLRTDRQPFIPHITVGRKLSALDQGILTTILAARGSTLQSKSAQIRDMIWLALREKKWVVERVYPFAT